MKYEEDRSNGWEIGIRLSSLRESVRVRADGGVDPGTAKDSTSTGGRKVALSVAGYATRRRIRAARRSGRMDIQARRRVLHTLFRQ